MTENASIIKKELNSENNKELSRQIIKHEEDWHNGKTFKYNNILNKTNNIEHYQFKTIIEEKKCFIYDEIIQINNKPVLFLNLWDDNKNEVNSLIIYLKDDNVIQQIRKINYQQFVSEHEKNKDVIKTTENDNTIIIKTPFLDFIEEVNNEAESENNNENILNEEKNENKKWKKYCWIAIKIMAFIGCIVISTIIGIIPTAVILGIVAIKPIAVAVSIGLGFIAIPWNNIRNKIVDWVFKKKKGKYEEEIEKLKFEKDKQNQEVKTLKKEIFLSLTTEAKQQRILNAFLQLWERNKSKDFITLKNNLNEKFVKRKQEVQKEEFTKLYKKKINEWNQNWKEKTEFSENLAPEHIAEIKEIFAKQKKKMKLCVMDFFIIQSRYEQHLKKN